MKDIDFLENLKTIKILNEYPLDKRLPLSLILEKDAMFFESVEVMDYSLLIAEILEVTISSLTCVHAYNLFRSTASLQERMSDKRDILVIRLLQIASRQ